MRRNAKMMVLAALMAAGFSVHTDVHAEQSDLLVYPNDDVSAMRQNGGEDDDDGGGSGEDCPNDADCDTVPDDMDNCPDTSNADQKASDSDEKGDACDPCPKDPKDECESAQDGDEGGSGGKQDPDEEPADEPEADDPPQDEDEEEEEDEAEEEKNACGDDTDCSVGLVCKQGKCVDQDAQPEQKSDAKEADKDEKSDGSKDEERGSKTKPKRERKAEEPKADEPKADDDESEGAEEPKAAGQGASRGAQADDDEADAPSSDDMALSALCPDAKHLDADSAAGQRVLQNAKDCQQKIKKKTHRLTEDCECEAIAAAGEDPAEQEAKERERKDREEREARREAARKAAEAGDLTAQLAGLESDVKRLREELSEERKAAGQAREELEKAKAAHQGIKDDAEQAKDDAEAARKDAEQAKDDAKKVRGEVEAAEQARKEAEQKLGEAKGEVEKAGRRAEQEAEELETAKGETKEAGKALDKAKEKRDEAARDATRARERFEETERRLQQKAEEAERKAEEAKRKYGDSSEAFKQAAEAMNAAREAVEDVRKSMERSDDLETQALGRLKTAEAKLKDTEREYAKAVAATQDAMVRLQAITVLDEVVRGRAYAEIEAETKACMSDTNRNGQVEWDDVCIAKIVDCRSHPNPSPDYSARPQSDGNTGLREETSWDVYTQHEALGWNYRCLGAEITLYGHTGLKVDGVIKQLEMQRQATAAITERLSAHDAKFAALEGRVIELEADVGDPDNAAAQPGTLTQELRDTKVGVKRAQTRADEAYGKVTARARFGYLYTRNRALRLNVDGEGGETVTLDLRGSESQGVSGGGCIGIDIGGDTEVCIGVMFSMLATSANDLSTGVKDPMVDLAILPMADITYRLIEDWLHVGAYGGVLFLTQTNPNDLELQTKAGVVGGRLVLPLDGLVQFSMASLRGFVQVGARFDNIDVTIANELDVVGTSRNLLPAKVHLEGWVVDGLFGIEGVLGFADLSTD